MEYAKGKTIKDLPKTKRPREKLAAIGLSNLTEEELLAIILGFGTKNKNVLTVSKNLLKKFPLKKLIHTSLADLVKIDGIGEVQAGKILAAIELGIRACNPDIGQKIIATPEAVLQEVIDIKAKTQEYMLALYLNARNQLIQKQVVSIGGLNKNAIEARDIFSYAITTPCATIILVHNHPSADPTPSEDDIKFTKRIEEVGDILGIQLVDHLIIAKNEYFSFKEAGLIS